jgi:hypothetical protein
MSDYARVRNGSQNRNPITPFPLVRFRPKSRDRRARWGRREVPIGEGVEHQTVLAARGKSGL